MKVKEIERTANVAWSPASQYPVYLVAGTAAQQLDATFSTSAALEVYSLNLADNGLGMPLVGSLPSPHRFYKVLWGCHGISTGENPSGVIIAGSENGSVLGYNAASLIGGNEEGPTFRQDKHSGAVKALDFNPFQANLLASGACDSEIYIWDLNKPDTPMSPGSKSMPPEEVTCISWNCQVQHILASTFSARCVVWDLRKNEPIIKVSDSMSGIKSHLISWNPEIATQLCLSSEDDHSPVIQLWDLRYATSPLRVFEKHQRGILSLAWCPQDPDLLLSCGKDNKILCWNPNTTIQGGEVVCEIETSNQWSFDVQWCPRNPGIISSASFDGHVTIHSLMSGESPSPSTNKIAESFNTDPFGNAHPVTRDASTIIPLQKPPKWLRKPVGANFAFGGKLVSFDYTLPSNTPSQGPAAGVQPQSRQVHISQVITETDILARSSQLEEALKSNQLLEFCTMKAENSSNSMEQNVWNFLKTNFENEPRPKFLQLLGYDKNELSQKVVTHINTKTGAIGVSGDGQRPDPVIQTGLGTVSDEKGVVADEQGIINEFGFDGQIGGLETRIDEHGVNAAELAEKMSLLNTTDAVISDTLPSSGQGSPSVDSKTSNSIGEPSEASSMFEDIALQQRNLSGSQSPLVIPTNSGQSGTSGTQSPLVVPAQSGRSGTQSPLVSTQFDASATPLAIPTKAGAEGLLGQALLTGNFEAAVEMCIHENKMAEAILLAVAGGPELLCRTQEKYFSCNKSSLSRLISSIVTRDWNHIIQTCDLQNWKEALAVIITYASPEEFAILCDSLGARLEVDKGGEYSMYASLCYICSGNVQKFVENWQTNSQSTESPLALQDLVEKVMMLRKAVELSQGEVGEIQQGLVAGKLSTYASILAAQGCLDTAMNYLGSSTEKSLSILRDRLYQALGSNLIGIDAPPFPFEKINILPEGVQPAHSAQQTQPLQSSYPTQQIPAAQPAYAQPQQHPSKQLYQPASKQRQTLQKQQEEQIHQQNVHQTQAISQFRTNTTPSSYFGLNQYPNTNGPPSAPPSTGNIPQTPAYPTHMSSMMAPPSGAPMSKGPLAHKYPAQADPAVTGYGMDTYNQPNVMTPDYSNTYQQQPYYGGTYPSQGIYQPQPTPVQSQQTNAFNSMSTPGAPQSAAAVMAVGSLAPSFQETKPHTPWNDPPLLKDKSASQQQTGWNDPPLVDPKSHQSYDVTGPITAPIYGVPVNNEQPPPGAPVNNYPTIYNPQEHQAPVQPPTPVQPAEPVPEVVKGPLPNEHQVLQDTFDGLVDNCLKAANNAQTKRKLEDVTKKLEALYDKLRDNSLSQNILLGLHQIVQALQKCDYNEGLQIYAHIIGQGNFSEIGSFMPGLKMLMQTANNLKIYIQ